MLRVVDKLTEAAAALCLAASALMICANVFRRYVVLDWLGALAERAKWMAPVAVFFDEAFAPIGAVADEVPGLLLVWISFLGAYLVQRRGGHIRFEVLTDMLPPQAKSAVALAVNLLLLGFFILLFAQSLRMILVDGSTEIETAEIAQGWFMAVMPISAALLSAAVIGAILNRRGDRDEKR